MTVEESIARLDTNAAQFAECIASLPEELYLALMDAWAPRDVLAHLIGWNRYTVEGGAMLTRGELPPYFVDTGDDFAATNAVLVRAYPSRDRQALLTELETSLAELRCYLRTLTPVEWGASVPYGKDSITVENVVQALADDYANHRRQIERWVQSRC